MSLRRDFQIPIAKTYLAVVSGVAALSYLCDDIIGFDGAAHHMEDIHVSSMMDHIEMYLAQGMMDREEGQSASGAEVIKSLFHTWNYQCCFERLFTACPPVYFAGYVVIASIATASAAARQEYSIKAIRHADLAVHRGGRWCEAGHLEAFRRRWPSADGSLPFALHWADCGVRKGPVSWTSLLAWLCAEAARGDLNGGGNLPSTVMEEFFRPRHPLPATAVHFCDPSYLTPPAIGSAVELDAFAKLLTPRIRMVASPLWSREVWESCLPDWQCSLQSHYLLSEALRHVHHYPPGLYIEFGVWEGRTANITARYLQALANFSSNASCGAACAIRAPLLYAFDSFYGLLGDWYTHKRGSFNRNGIPPPLESNVQPIVGWFNDSLDASLLPHAEVYEQILFLSTATSTSPPSRPSTRCSVPDSCGTALL